MTDLEEIPTNPHAETYEIWGTLDIELQRAYRKHGRAPWSRHEFYAILLEEFNELWTNIMQDAPDDAVVAELIEVMAVCQRYLETGDRWRGPLGRTLQLVADQKAHKLTQCLTSSATPSSTP